MDNASTLYNRINAQGYEECQDDILAASGIAEDIRDALLEHQVSDGQAWVAVALLKSNSSNRRSTNGRHMSKIAG